MLLVGELIRYPVVTVTRGVPVFIQVLRSFLSYRSHKVRTLARLKYGVVVDADVHIERTGAVLPRAPDVRSEGAQGGDVGREQHEAGHRRAALFRALQRVETDVRALVLVLVLFSSSCFLNPTDV